MEQLPLLSVRRRRAGQGRRIIVSHSFLTQLQTSKAHLLQKKRGDPISFLRDKSEPVKGGPPAGSYDWEPYRASISCVYSRSRCNWASLSSSKIPGRFASTSLP
jgi:hypothetical protein